MSVDPNVLPDADLKTFKNVKVQHLSNLKMPDVPIYNPSTISTSKNYKFGLPPNVELDRQKELVTIENIHERTYTAEKSLTLMFKFDRSNLKNVVKKVNLDDIIKPKKYDPSTERFSYIVKTISGESVSSTAVDGAVHIKCDTWPDFNRNTVIGLNDKITDTFCCVTNEHKDLKSEKYNIMLNNPQKKSAKETMLEKLKRYKNAKDVMIFKEMCHEFDKLRNTETGDKIYKYLDHGVWKSPESGEDLLLEILFLAQQIPQRVVEAFNDEKVVDHAFKSPKDNPNDLKMSLLNGTETAFGKFITLMPFYSGVNKRYFTKPNGTVVIVSKEEFDMTKEVLSHIRIEKGQTNEMQFSAEFESVKTSGGLLLNSSAIATLNIVITVLITVEKKPKEKTFVEIRDDLQRTKYGITIPVGYEYGWTIKDIKKKLSTVVSEPELVIGNKIPSDDDLVSSYLDMTWVLK